MKKKEIRYLVQFMTDNADWITFAVITREVGKVTCLGEYKLRDNRCIGYPTLANALLDITSNLMSYMEDNAIEGYRIIKAYR